MILTELLNRYNCTFRERNLLLAKLYEIRFQKLLDEFAELKAEILKTKKL